MPWTCLSCKQPTYRRDKRCHACRASRRGVHHKLVASVRLRRKTQVKTLERHQICYGALPLSSPAAANRKVLLETWQESVERECSELLSEVVSLSARHSVLSHVHSLLQAAAEQGHPLPPADTANQLGLLFSAMSLSACLSDPDALFPKLAKRKSVDMKNIIRSQCCWINFIGNQ